MSNRINILLFGSDFENNDEFDEFGAPTTRVNNALRTKLQGRRNAVIIWRIVLFALIIPEVLMVANAYADAVVASYIHEISTRTRRPRGASASPWRATHPLD